MRLLPCPVSVVATIVVAGACTGCVGPSPTASGGVRVPLAAAQLQAGPLGVHAIEVEASGQVQALPTAGAITSSQRFALQVQTQEPLHLYVLLHRGSGEQVLLHPLPGVPTPPQPAGMLRLPAIGDWYVIGQLLIGDRLCLMGSLRPQGALSCDAASRQGSLGRGEDIPPPPPPRPDPKKTAQRTPPPPPPPPPPPDDLDRDRGKGVWTIALPLATS